MTEKKNRPVLNFLGRIFNHPLIRGIFKALPVGNLVYEVAENIQHSRDPQSAGQELPHSPVSLLAQLVFLALIVYAFITHQITANDLIRYITPEDFKHVGTLPVDSLVK